MLINSKKAIDFINGSVILVNKPKGWTSFSVVKKVRFLIKKKFTLKKIKVGHAGTLDPLATGLLVLCTGKSTKTITQIQNQHKVYIGEITLGGSTASYDLETKIDKYFPTDHITEKMIKDTAGLFIGEIKQKPPIFSALKQDGERLYKKARRGEIPKIEARNVFVKNFKILKIEMPKISFEITCSKGTYIRSIAHEFGKKINSGSYLSSLCRTEIGAYKLKNSISITEFENILNS